MNELFDCKWFSTKSMKQTCSRSNQCSKSSSSSSTKTKALLLTQQRKRKQQQNEQCANAIVSNFKSQLVFVVLQKEFCFVCLLHQLHYYLNLIQHFYCFKYLKKKNRLFSLKISTKKFWPTLQMLDEATYRRMYDVQMKLNAKQPIIFHF